MAANTPSGANLYILDTEEKDPWNPQNIRLNNRDKEIIRTRIKSLAMKVVYTHSILTTISQSCTQQVESFVECTKNRTLSVVFACKGELKEVNNCLGAQYETNFLCERLGQTQKFKRK